MIIIGNYFNVEGTSLLKNFKGLENLRKVGDIFTREDRTPLRMGVLHGLLENWLVPILIKYFKKYDRNIEIFIQSQKELKHSIESGRCDLIFSTENIQSELISSLF